MQDIDIKVITKKAELPPDAGDNFFHSNTLFGILDSVPHVVPFLITACNSSGEVVARMMCIVRRNALIIKHGHIFGEGVYRDIKDKAEIFKFMADAATKMFRRHHCFYIEISGISEKMFGYGTLRSLGYFPIRWIEINNSLKEKNPEERLRTIRRRRIHKSIVAGVKTIEVKDDETFTRFFSMLKHFYTSKPHRYTPHVKEIHDVGRSRYGKIYVTMYKNMVIGGCVCINSNKNTYLWHMAAKRKTFSTLFPASHMIWHAIGDAKKNGNRYFHFMDVGVPFGKAITRDFILSFGGRPVSSYRWFSCSLWGVNRLFSKLFSS